MELSTVPRRLILHWGEMGTRWGVNRTVAQVHALLYLSPDPLNAEQIAETLNVARSNVSTSLRELQSWGIVHVVSNLGDRRDYFETMTDVWEMFRIILDQRKAREVDPTVQTLRECVGLLENQKNPDPYTHDRLLAMLDFFQTMTQWYTQMRSLPTGTLVKLTRMGSRIAKIAGLAKT